MGKFDHGQRVPVGRLDQVREVHGERVVRGHVERGEELTDSLRRQAPEVECRQVGHVLRHLAGARAHHQGHGIGLQPPCDKREDFKGVEIDPMSVVDHDQQGTLCGRAAQHCENRESKMEALEGFVGESQRCCHRAVLREGQGVHSVQQWRDQTIQSREDDPSLGLRARNSQDPELPSPRGDVFKEMRLARACLTHDQQRSALLRGGPHQQFVQPSHLEGATDERSMRRRFPSAGSARSAVTCWLLDDSKVIVGCHSGPVLCRQLPIKGIRRPRCLDPRSPQRNRSAPNQERVCSL